MQMKCKKEKKLKEKSKNSKECWLFIDEWINEWINE